MQEQISLREVNQHLSRYIYAVEKGAEFVITRYGKPVAKIVPLDDEMEPRVLTLKQEAALERIKQRLEKGYFLGIGKIDRDAMYMERWERNGRS